MLPWLRLNKDIIYFSKNILGLEALHKYFILNCNLFPLKYSSSPSVWEFKTYINYIKTHKLPTCTWWILELCPINCPYKVLLKVIFWIIYVDITFYMKIIWCQSGREISNHMHCFSEKQNNIQEMDLLWRLINNYLENFTLWPTLHESFKNLEFIAVLIIVFHMICLHSLMLGLHMYMILSWNIMQFYICFFVIHNFF